MAVCILCAQEYDSADVKEIGFPSVLQLVLAR